MKKSVRISYLTNFTNPTSASTKRLSQSKSPSELQSDAKPKRRPEQERTHLLIPLSPSVIVVDATTTTFSLAAVVRPRAVAAAAVAGLVEVRHVAPLAAATLVGVVGAVAARVGEDGLATHAGWDWSVE